MLPFTDNYIGKEPRQLLCTMLGAVFFVLLIACANVANLLLDRAAHRTKEVGIRTALGASRSAVVRQFLAEALVLSLAATVFGIALAQVGIMLFNQRDHRHAGSVLHRHQAASAGAVVLDRRRGPDDALLGRDSGVSVVARRHQRNSQGRNARRVELPHRPHQQGLVMFEIALSCGLLVAAGLMIKSVTKMSTMDTGFTSKDVFTARIGFPAAYTDTAAEWRFFDQVVERVAALPGVQAAAFSTGLPAARQG